jgi:hypothetical protein
MRLSGNGDIQMRQQNDHCVVRAQGKAWRIINKQGNFLTIQALAKYPDGEESFPIEIFATLDISYVDWERYTEAATRYLAAGFVGKL